MITLKLGCQIMDGKLPGVGLSEEVIVLSQNLGGDLFLIQQELDLSYCLQACARKPAKTTSCTRSEWKF